MKRYNFLAALFGATLLLGGCREEEKIADDLVKLAAAIEKMDKSTNIIHYVEAFIRFEDWLMEHRKEYPELPDEVVMILHRLHDDFISPFFIKK